MFTLDKCTIRPAEFSDLADLTRMAKTIWEGTDYLPGIAAKWIAEGGFFVALYNNQVIGCVKVTMLPDNVLWFEGLRVHARYQGQGVGRLINAYAFEYAERLRACNQNLAYEFCTYYLNTESLHMAKKAGFRIVQRFYAISKKGIKVCQRPEIIEEYGLNLFKSVRKYIPSGWQSVHKHPDSLPWLKARCTVFKTPKAIYLLGGISGKSIFPLTRFQGDIKQELPYFQYFYSSYKPIEIILPRSWKGVLPELQKKKFKFWEPNPDLKPNMYILRKY